MTDSPGASWRRTALSRRCGWPQRPVIGSMSRAVSPGAVKVDGLFPRIGEKDILPGGLPSPDTPQAVLPGAGLRLDAGLFEGSVEVLAGFHGRAALIEAGLPLFAAGEARDQFGHGGGKDNPGALFTQLEGLFQNVEPQVLARRQDQGAVARAGR